MSFVHTPKQAQWFEAVLSGRYTILGAGGGIRGAKTFGGLSILFLLARLYPRSRWAIVRDSLPTMRRNTIPSLEKLRAEANGFIGQIKVATADASPWSYPCRNGSEILLFPENIAKDPDHNRWKGLEVNGFLLEEANELAEGSFNMAIMRAGAWIIPPTETEPEPVQPAPVVLCTFNPDDNWVRRKFYDPWKAGTLEPPYFFEEMLAKDNPYLPKAYLDNLENLPEAEYKRFVLGDWDAKIDPQQLIQYPWVRNALEVEHTPGEKTLGVDVGMSQDETTFALMDGNGLVSLAGFKGQGGVMWIPEIAQMVMERCTTVPINAENVRIDSVGIGAGTVGDCRRAGFGVLEFVAGASQIEGVTFPGIMDPETPLEFADLRSQAWWTVRELLRTGQLAILLDDGPELSRLTEDLCAPRWGYDIGHRKIKVESKQALRDGKRLGRSTDYGDAFVMAVAECVQPGPVLLVL